ncbi:MAG TPA: cbb3-type cytochrome c oxidase subunit 3 [Rhodocyclaceae bacterium]|nr:cbb3-type cytochrome c oxidase subunit 3 [Rhodocyclaceae bacterium]
MDINDLRSLTTVIMLVVFAGIVWWAYSAKYKQAFEEAAQLPLDDDSDIVPGSRSAGQSDK